MSDITGYVGIGAGICTGISMLPQLIKIIHEKKAEDISILYLVALFTGLILWIIYGIGRKDIPVIATNIFSAIISMITFWLSIKFKKQN